MPSVDQILRAMPPKERAILTFARCHFPFGTLVVTPRRIVILLQDGGVDVTRYADVASFSVIEGRKKLLGGYSETMFNTQLRNGTRYSGQGIGTDGPWAIRTAQAMLAAHEAYSLRAR
jgi:hypothetical protein